MLYVLILAFVLTCVSCGERNALGLSTRTNEDSVPLDPSRRNIGIFGGVLAEVVKESKGWWNRRSTDVRLN
ncbi:hypothetical protein DPMN_170679 [Dreissena polymorpha]|uniref:Secreted protein n=1 Tax=Dreissena polymorpha TaxID=45954 RepID=A0A9D4DXG4_DREPO|nr:hypothetical protein DPMN_170679 [Dreissena polymorpha]